MIPLGMIIIKPGMIPSLQGSSNGTTAVVDVVDSAMNGHSGDFTQSWKGCMETHYSGIISISSPWIGTRFFVFFKP